MIHPENQKRTAAALYPPDIRHRIRLLQT